MTGIGNAHFPPGRPEHGKATVGNGNRVTPFKTPLLLQKQIELVIDAPMAAVAPLSTAMLHRGPAWYRFPAPEQAFHSPRRAALVEVYLAVISDVRPGWAEGPMARAYYQTSR